MQVLQQNQYSEKRQVSIFFTFQIFKKLSNFDSFCHLDWLLFHFQSYLEPSSREFQRSYSLMSILIKASVHGIYFPLLAQYFIIANLMNQFWLKYFLRVCHIGSIIALCHKTISDYSAGAISTNHALFYGIAGLVCMGSGFMNTFILKPEKMGEKRKLWVGYQHLKLLITLILYSPLGKAFGDELVNVRMFWICSIILIAPYMRFYREKYSSII